MSAFHDLTAAQLRHVIHLKERIEYLQGLLASLRGAAVPATATKKKVDRSRTVSPGTRGKKARSVTVKTPVAKKKGGITQKGRTKLAATMRAQRSAKKKSVRASKTLT